MTNRDIIQGALALHQEKVRELEAILAANPASLSNEANLGPAMFVGDVGTVVHRLHTENKPKKAKRTLSAAARKSIAAAQKKRWTLAKRQAKKAKRHRRTNAEIAAANEKKSAAKTKPAKATPVAAKAKKRVLTAESRKAISDAQKKRWAKANGADKQAAPELQKPAPEPVHVAEPEAPAAAAGNDWES